MQSIPDGSDIDLSDDELIAGFKLLDETHVAKLISNLFSNSIGSGINFDDTKPILWSQDLKQLEELLKLDTTNDPESADSICKLL